MTLFQDTPVPTEILHLDFDPDATTQTEEKPEEPKLCRMLHRRPSGGDYMCLRPAHWKVNLDMKDTCGDTSTTYVCDECWGIVQRNPKTRWRCAPGCDKEFVVMAAVVGLARIK